MERLKYVSNCTYNKHRFPEDTSVIMFWFNNYSV